MMRAAAMAAAVLVAAGCATTKVPPRDRMQVELGHRNEARELAVSVFVAPFFRDASRRLVSVEPPADTEFLVTPKGEPIEPGPVQEVLPAGTRVRVVKIEFPTRWVSFWRPLITPKDRIWLELAVEGRPVPPTFLYVLPPEPESGDDVTKAIETLLSRGGVHAEVATMPEADRRMIATKILEPGTSLRALQLAFGTPNLRRIHGDGTSVAEEWTWHGRAGPRTAYLKDGVVVRVEPSAEAAQPAPSAQP